MEAKRPNQFYQPIYNRIVYIHSHIFNDIAPIIWSVDDEHTWVDSRRLPDLPEFEGQPEEWQLFLWAFRETTAAYQCTELENNQRLGKSLARSLLIHPRNVEAVMNQLRFWYGRPDLLIGSQLKSLRDVQPSQQGSCRSPQGWAAWERSWSQPRVASRT